MTTTKPHPKPRIMIYGSCVTRDIVRIDDGATLDLQSYVARSSFASSFSPVRFDKSAVDTGKLKSAFQKRMVEIDLFKRLPSILETVDYDILVVDLIDERFALLETDQSAICTASNELLATGISPQKDFARRIPSGSDRHFSLWSKGWDAFVSEMKRLNRFDRVYLNKVFWSTSTEDGNAEIDIYSADHIAAANAYLSRMYGHIEKSLPADRVFSFDETVFVSTSDHQWGLSPFHYVDRYYDDARAQILEAAASVSAAAPGGDEPVSFGASEVSRDSTFPLTQLHLHPLSTPEEQEQTGFLGGFGTEPWPYSFPLDWNADPFKHRNWRYRLGCWRLMDTYIRDFIDGGSAENLEKILAIALDWHRFYLVEGNRSDFLWYDMATGLRAAKLGWLLEQVSLGNLILSQADMTMVDEMAARHFDMLTRPDEIAMNNHGLFQVFGLEMLSRYWRDGDRQDEAREFGRAQLQKLMALSYTPEGVHMEASPEYHSFVLRALERSSRGSAFAESIKGTIALARNIEPFLAMPDGRFPAMGDTDNDQCNDKVERLRADRIERVAGKPIMVKDLSASGYALARSHPNTALEKSWMLFVTGMAHVKTHKHGDDLSFVFYQDGQSVFVDPGKYFYDYSDTRKYMTSAQAHNVVSLEKRLVGPHDVEFVGSELNGLSVTKETVTISGKVTRPALFDHIRIFDLEPEQRLVIRDLMRKTVPEAFINRLHIHPDVAVDAEESEVRLTLKSGRIVRVRSRSGAAISLLRGEKRPRGGWYSPTYSKIVECTTIETRFDEDVVDDGWIIDLD